MQDFFKSYGSISLAIVTVIVSLIGQWAVLGTRVSAVEDRQDRQGESITDIKAQLATQAANYAELKAKIDAMSDNINYIRSRIDRATQ